MAPPVPLVTWAVQAKGPVFSGMLLDNGVALMASHLLRAGYQPRVFDYNTVGTVGRIASGDDLVAAAVEELTEYVTSTGARMLGFKLYSNGFASAIRIADALRTRFPELLLVAGGPQVEWFMGSLLDYCSRVLGRDVFDVLVHGDGDLAIQRLADLAYRTGGDVSGIPNVLYRDRTTGEILRTKRAYQLLDDLPVPTYEPEVYDTTGKIHVPVVEDSRSCDHACSFCVHPRIGGKRRERPIDDVLAEIEHYRQRHGWRIFRLAGPKPTAEYMDALVAGLPADARFTAFGYADQSYAEAAESGKLIGLFTGLESADPTALESAYRKTRSASDYLNAAREMIALFKRRGLANVVSMIVPSPNETDAAMELAQGFLQETSPDFVPCLPICPIPGTPLTRLAQRDPERAGVLLDDDFAFKAIQFETDLLRPPDTWPTPPWQVRVRGRFLRNAFAEVTAPFVGRLMGSGMSMLSDEQVLTTYLHDDGLSADQTERRAQCVRFSMATRDAIAGGGVGALSALVERVNDGQRVSGPLTD